MNPNEYQKLAGRTECNQEQSALRMHLGCPKSIRLNHAILGLAGKLGKLAGAVEKWLYYNQPLDLVNLKEELGDSLWYHAEICNALDLSLEDVMEDNIAKIQQRYPEKYSDLKSAETGRDRKAERKVLASGLHLQDESG